MSHSRDQRELTPTLSHFDDAGNDDHEKRRHLGDREHCVDARAPDGAQSVDRRQGHCNGDVFMFICAQVIQQTLPVLVVTRDHLHTITCFRHCRTSTQVHAR